MKITRVSVLEFVIVCWIFSVMIATILVALTMYLDALKSPTR